MRFCGIDLSLRAIHVCAVDVDTHQPDMQICLLPDRSLPVKIRQLGNSGFPRGAWWDDVAFVAVEEPFGYSPHQLNRLLGGVVASIPLDGARIWTVRPHEWRKALGLPGSGKRAALKQNSERWAKAHGARSHWDTDQCEALCIAHAGIRLNWPDDELEAAA